MSLFTSLAATLLAGTIATAATPVLAQDAIGMRDGGIEPTHVPVRIGDLDLDTAAGQAVLQHRLHLAASQACSDAGAGLSTAMAAQAVSACRSTALGRANVEVAERTHARHLAMH